MQPHALPTCARPGIRYYRTERRSFAPVFGAVALLVLGLAVANVALVRDLFGQTAPTHAVPRVASASPHVVLQKHKVVRAPPTILGAINPLVPGLTTFRGNLTRDYYGVGPVPHTAPQILWRYPRAGGMCLRSDLHSGAWQVRSPSSRSPCRRASTSKRENESR